MFPESNILNDATLILAKDIFAVTLFGNEFKIFSAVCNILNYLN